MITLRSLLLPIHLFTALSTHYCAADIVQLHVAVNSAVTLLCNSVVPGDVAWHYHEYTPPRVSLKKIVYLAGIVYNDFKNRFQVNNTNNFSHVLVINSVRKSDSGFYGCIEEDGQGVLHQFFQVICEDKPRKKIDVTTIDSVSGATSVNTLNDSLWVALAFAAVLIFLVIIVSVALFFIRYCRKRQQPGNEDQAVRIVLEENDEMVRLRVENFQLNVENEALRNRIERLEAEKKGIN